MDTLDTPAQPAPAPLWNTALIYGAYCGGVLIAFSLLTYLLNLNLMSISGMLILYGGIFGIGFTLAALAMRHQRDQLDGGYISYGKAFLVGLLTVFIGMFISGLWNYVLVNFIDPDYIAIMKDQFMEQWGENMPPDRLEEALEGFEKAGDFLNTLKSSLMGGLFIGLITSLITAAFMKKQPEISMH